MSQTLAFSPMASPVEAALKKLGVTAEAVRASLRSAGIKGKKNLCGEDVLSKYLEKTVPGLSASCFSDSIRAAFRRPDGTVDGPVYLAYTPATLEFADRFERGEYPELLVA